MKRMLSIRRPGLAVVAVALLLGACGEGAGETATAPTATPGPTATPTPRIVVDPPPPRDYLRVAYINMMSPIQVDVEDAVAGETFEMRLDVLIDELRALDADVIALSEVSWTQEHGGVTEELARELRMEFQYVRANPWFPGQSKEQSDATTRQIGFEEGELLLSRYPILRTERYALNPRTSETEGRALLHAVVDGPPGFGEIDVYVTRISGGENRVRELQVTNLVTVISRTRGAGHQLLLGDLALSPEASALSLFAALGMDDVVALDGGRPPATCCRSTVVGAQPTLVVRTDYAWVRGLGARELRTFAHTPAPIPGFDLLYASDHNGLVFTLFLED